MPWRRAGSAGALCTVIVILLKMQTGEPVCPGTKTIGRSLYVTVIQTLEINSLEKRGGHFLYEALSSVDI